VAITRILRNYSDLAAGVFDVLDKAYREETTAFEKECKKLHAQYPFLEAEPAREALHAERINLILHMEEWWCEFLVVLFSKPNDEPFLLDKDGKLCHSELLRAEKISFRKDSNFVIYQDSIYEIRGSYSEEQQKLLVLECADKERQKFENLKRRFSGEASKEIEYHRERIPEDVRIAVWRRDQGKCARCGSREKLEYDHIIPMSKGGGNTVRNIELLCQNCNRSKGNSIS
jgi:hypothetical protein